MPEIYAFHVGSNYISPMDLHMGLDVVDLTSERPSFCFKPSGIIDRAIDKMLGEILFLGGGNSNMFYFQPYLGKTNPF